MYVDSVPCNPATEKVYNHHSIASPPIYIYSILLGCMYFHFGKSSAADLDKYMLGNCMITVGHER